MPVPGHSIHTPRHQSRARSTYAAFLRDVGTILDVRRDDAARFASAVLATLEELIPARDVLRLEAQLPSILRDILRESEVRDLPWMSRELFVYRVARRADCPIERAEVVTRALFVAIRQHVSSGESERLVAALPADLRPLFI